MTGAGTPKAAVFDFNGVVITNTDLETFRAAAQARGVWFPLFLARYCLHNCAHLTGKLDSFSFWSKVLAAEKPLTREEYERLLVQPYLRNTFIREVGELVAALRRRGVKCVLLTNTSEYQVAANRALKRYVGFDALVLSNEAHCMKPFPSAFRLALQTVQAAPSETVFVDDSWYNVWMARLLGFKAVAYCSPGQLKTAIKSLCGPILD